MTVTFSIKRAYGDKPPVRISVADLESKTVGDLKRDFLSAINQAKKDVNRIRFSLELSNEVLGPNEKALSLLKFPKEFTEISLIYKDLGPQISWKTVFIVEYFVPMIAFPAIWFILKKTPSLAKLIYPVSKTGVSEWQTLMAILFTLHFIKREFETIFIHRFGNDTMPVSNIFKNSGYYWLFAIWIAYATLHPLYTMPPNLNQRNLGVGLFVIAELCNLKAHVDLRNLRPAGSRIRKVPNTLLFSLVSCPNYLCEILAWVGFTLASQSVAAGVFTLVGAAQMTQWALQKHKRYRREFDGVDGRELYPKGRKAIMPFLL